MSGRVIDEAALLEAIVGEAPPPVCPHDVEMWEATFAFPSHRHTVIDGRYWCQVYCSVCGIDWSDRHEVGCVVEIQEADALGPGYRIRFHQSCLTDDPWPPTFGPAPADCNLAYEHPPADIPRRRCLS